MKTPVNEAVGTGALSASAPEQLNLDDYDPD